MQTKPSFLKRLDQYLLTNKPVIWSTRVHTVLWYGLLFSIVISLLSFFGAGDVRQASDIYNWIILISVISILAFVFWLVFLLRFNVFKRYGKWGRLDSLKTFIIYFLIIFLFTSWPVLPQIFESYSANRAYTTQELVNDVNKLNINISLLERDIVDVKFKTDTIQLSGINASQRKVVNDESGYSVYSDNYYYVDSASLQSRLQEADSIRKISDSLFIIYQSPNYRFVHVYSLPEEADKKVLSSVQLFNSAIKNKPSFNPDETRHELQILLSKYAIPNTWDGPLSLNPTYEQIISKKYNLDAVNEGLSHITSKKYWWDNGTTPLVFRVVYYLSFFIALLVFIYRHTTRKTFFLTLLSATLILILTFLLIAANNGGEYSLGWLLFYFVLFAGLSLFIFNAAVRSTVAGISLNLALVLVPLVPLVIVSIIYIGLHNRNYYRYSNGYAYYKMYPNESFHYLLAEIGGSIILILLMATIIQKLYRKWYSLPDE